MSTIDHSQLIERYNEMVKEIARLRSEVERLKDEVLGNRGAYETAAKANGDLRHERDEALAQAAVLLLNWRRLIADARECELTYDSAYSLLKRTQREAEPDIPTEARALLDRLQKAEAVVRAADTFINAKKWVAGAAPGETFGMMNHPHATAWISEWKALKDALTASRERA